MMKAGGGGTGRLRALAVLLLSSLFAHILPSAFFFHARNSPDHRRWEIMGASMRLGVRVGVGVSAFVVAIPACLVLVWVAVGCMWVVGLVSVVKLVWRKAWSGEYRKRKKRRLKKKVVDGEEEEEKSAAMRKMRRLEEEESADVRVSLFHQYLEDQLNTLAHQLWHVYRSDSIRVEPLDLHVGMCDWPAALDAADCVQDQHVRHLIL